MRIIRRFLLSVLFLALPFCVLSAQKASYSYKPLSDRGCSVRLYINKQDTAYYLFTTISSDDLRFLGQSTLQIRTFNDYYIKLNGESIGESSTNSGFMAGTVFIPVHQLKSTARFYIEANQLELLRDGIKKIRLSTIPYDQEKSFKKDKIGKRLYKQYIKLRDANHEF